MTLQLINESEEDNMDAAISKAFVSGSESCNATIALETRGLLRLIGELPK